MDRDHFQVCTDVPASFKNSVQALESHCFPMIGMNFHNNSNRPPDLVHHFRVLLRLCFKTSLSAKPFI